MIAGRLQLIQNANFLFVGVGGQGIILASDVAAEVGVKLGLDVKKSEIHGMSQRGGSVESHVRWADKVYSPLSARGEVDFLIAMEILESARWADYVAPGGVVIINSHRIAPLAVSTGQAEYPAVEDVRRVYLQRTSEVRFVGAHDIAKALGNTAVAGIVLLGHLSSSLDVDPSVWMDTIERRVPSRFVEINRQAFLAGRSIVAA